MYMVDNLCYVQVHEDHLTYLAQYQNFYSALDSTLAKHPLAQPRV